MKFKYSYFIFHFLFMQILLQALPGRAAILVTHKLGTLKLAQAPKKIVALEFSFVDALAVLGASPVGIADDGDKSRIIEPLSKRIRDWKSVGMRKQPSLELMASLRPDLIVGDVIRHKGIYKQLSQIAPTILLESLGEDYTSDLESLKALAQALNRDKDLPKILKDHREKISEYSVKLMKLPQLSGRKILFGVSWEDGVHLHTPMGYVPELFTRLGLTYATFPKEVSFNKASEKVTLEHLLSIDPDVVIMARSKPHVLWDEWAKSPLWTYLKAVKNKQIYFVDQTLWTRARGLLASQAMMKDLLQVMGKK